MTRTNARQLALQLSFAVSAGSDVGPDAFFDEDYFRALPAEDALFTEIPGEEERAYINALVTGVRDHREELDDLIEQFSHGWKLSRISRTALAVLRVALYEILYMPDIPAAARPAGKQSADSWQPRIWPGRSGFGKPGPREESLC